MFVVFVLFIIKVRDVCTNIYTQELMIRSAHKLLTQPHKLIRNASKIKVNGCGSNSLYKHIKGYRWPAIGNSAQPPRCTITGSKVQVYMY